MSFKITEAPPLLEPGGPNLNGDGVIFIKPDLFILSNPLDAIDVAHRDVIIAVCSLSRFAYAVQLVPSRRETRVEKHMLTLS